MIRTRFSTYAWVVLAYNLIVILWGAFVRATGSGAGCGNHWPLCNGVVMPRQPQIETMIEFAHRLTSGLAFILVLVLLVWAFRTLPQGSSRAPGGDAFDDLYHYRGAGRRRAGAVWLGGQRRVDRARHLDLGTPGQHLPAAGGAGADRLVGFRRRAHRAARPRPVGVAVRPSASWAC